MMPRNLSEKEMRMNKEIQALGEVYKIAIEGDGSTGLTLRRLLLALYNKSNRFDLCDLRYLDYNNQELVISVIRLEMAGLRGIHQYFDGMSNHFQEWRDSFK